MDGVRPTPFVKENSMSADEYADAVTHARLAVATMVGYHPGGTAALLHYEHLLFTPPVRRAPRPRRER
jgi:hypothetical protein